MGKRAVEFIVGAGSIGPDNVKAHKLRIIGLRSTVVGPHQNPRYNFPGAGRVKRSLADNARVKMLLGYGPEFDVQYGSMEAV